MCGSSVVGEAIKGGCVLDRCTRCGHIERDLGRCPADHRDLAYGGEPTLDRIRLDLTHRELVRDGRPGRVLEIGYGAGSLLRRFLDDGAEVAGVDPDQLLVDVDPVVRAHGDLRVGGIEETADLPATRTSSTASTSSSTWTTPTGRSRPPTTYCVPAGA